MLLGLNYARLPAGVEPAPIGSPSGGQQGARATICPGTALHALIPLPYSRSAPMAATAEITGRCVLLPGPQAGQAIQAWRPEQPTSTPTIWLNSVGATAGPSSRVSHPSLATRAADFDHDYLGVIIAQLCLCCRRACLPGRPSNPDPSSQLATD